MLLLMIEEKKQMQAEKEKQEVLAKRESLDLVSNTDTSLNKVNENIFEEKQLSSALSLPRTNST